MPFYEYQCEKCGHHVEVMQKITEAPLKKCPTCGKSSLKRLMSAPVFRLKGSGWYETDFKGDQDSKRNLADKPDADAPKDDAKDAKKEDKKVESPAASEAAPAAKDSKPAPAKVPAAKTAASKSASKSKPAGRKAAPARKAAPKAKKRR